jgi:hypothetical protein
VCFLVAKSEFLCIRVHSRLKSRAPFPIGNQRLTRRFLTAPAPNQSPSSILKLLFTHPTTPPLQHSRTPGSRLPASRAASLSRVGHALSRVVSRVGREKRPVFIDLSRCHGSGPPRAHKGPVQGPRSGTDGGSGKEDGGWRFENCGRRDAGECANTALYHDKPRLKSRISG